MSLFDLYASVLVLACVSPLFIVPFVTDAMEKRRIAVDTKRRALLQRVKEVTNADRNRLHDPRARHVSLLEMAVDLCLTGLVAACLHKRV